MTEDKLLNEIREVKNHCTSDLFDYEDGYGELCHMVFTALDVADELREAVLYARLHDKKIVYGREVPIFYKDVILSQLHRLVRELGGEI